MDAVIYFNSNYSFIEKERIFHHRRAPAEILKKGEKIRRKMFAVSNRFKSHTA